MIRIDRDDEYAIIDDYMLIDNYDNQLNRLI